MMTAPASMLNLVAFLQALQGFRTSSVKLHFLLEGMHCHIVSKTFLIPAVHMIYLQEIYPWLQHTALFEWPRLAQPGGIPEYPYQT